MACYGWKVWFMNLKKTAWVDLTIAFTEGVTRADYVLTMAIVD